MTTHKLVFYILVISAQVNAQTAPQADSLGRSNPRSTATAFLEACHKGNYGRAADYLDFAGMPDSVKLEGPTLARRLETVLNADSHFAVLRLSQDPLGNLSDDDNPILEDIATVSHGGKKLQIKLVRKELKLGSFVWLFSADTVALIPAFDLNTGSSAFESRFPTFLTSVKWLGTPLWKFLALLLVAVLSSLPFRFAARLLLRFTSRLSASRVNRSIAWLWIRSAVHPWLVLLWAMIFASIEQIIDPSALARLYIGRAILLVVVTAFAWGFINLVEISLARLESALEPRQRAVSRSMIHLGRRASKFVLVFCAAIVVLDNWGYNMSTVIAGLGVGGIALALAAQSTIANIFGGVSVVADRPVTVGDFGNFGGVIGTVEDIGMRSSRVRTLTRTMMSIPNSAFATMNLENYTLRDKILFNPSLQVNRHESTVENVQRFMASLERLIKEHERLQTDHSSVRISALSANSFVIEVFVYVLTPHLHEFYQIESSLFIRLHELILETGVQLV